MSTTIASVQSHYDVLQVSPRAGAEVIAAAYKALMKMHHPDVGGSTETARRIIEAHRILSAPDERKRYDSTRSAGPGTVIGNYRIIREIASGGFGTTYYGENTISHMPVCVKHCHHVSAAYETMLINEARAVWDLRHYSLPVMRDFLRLDDGSLALVMSYIPGPTLEQLVRKVGVLDPEHVAWIAERVLNALKYLHYNAVIHGDIKPQNLIVQPETHTIVLVDFGLSMVKPTSTSDPKGYTKVFSPPEQLEGSPLVPESDLYSLGMTLLYALGGSAEAATSLRVPASVPEPLCTFIRRLVRRSVLSRPSWTSTDLSKAIQDVRVSSFGRSSSNMKPFPNLV